MSLLRTAIGLVSEQRDLFATSSIIPSVENALASFTPDQATRIIAVLRCNQILADTVATLPVGVYETAGQTREPVEQPAWLATPVPEDPTITRIEHFSQAVFSYGLDGNIFTLVLPNIYDPQALYVLDPMKVEVRKEHRWRITVDGGREDVGPDQMIHIPRLRKSGTMRGLSPIEEASQLHLSTYRSALRFGRKVFDNGVYISGYVALPGAISEPSRKELKAELVEQYGAANQLKPGIFTNGAKWEVPQISLEALQFLDLQRASKTEIATLYGIPPYLIGVLDPGSVAYASTVQQAIDFEKFTIRPIVERIEAGYARLFPGDRYLRFDTDGLLRGDFKTRTEGYHNLLADKVIRPAEVRAREGWSPDPEMPGYLETPNNNPPPGRSEQRALDAGSFAVITGGLRR